MTYGFRALMLLEFTDADLQISADGMESKEPISGNDLRECSEGLEGNDLLESYEMKGYNPKMDIVILVSWMFCMHLVTIIYLLWHKYRARRAFVYSDE